MTLITFERNLLILRLELNHAIRVATCLRHKFVFAFHCEPTTEVNAVFKGEQIAVLAAPGFLIGGSFRSELARTRGRHARCFGRHGAVSVVIKREFQSACDSLDDIISVRILDRLVDGNGEYALFQRLCRDLAYLILLYGCSLAYLCLCISVMGYLIFSATKIIARPRIHVLHAVKHIVFWGDIPGSCVRS